MDVGRRGGRMAALRRAGTGKVLTPPEQMAGEVDRSLSMFPGQEPLSPRKLVRARVLIVPEGYTEAELPTFHEDAKNTAAKLVLANADECGVCASPPTSLSS
jgi:hypothetical protein